MTDNAPEWRPDPTGRFEHRYWDGTKWTDDVSNAGVASTDPYAGPTDAAPPSPTDPTLTPPAPDPTAVQAPAEPTATWPAPPPPSFPPAAGTAAAVASAGSKKGLMIGVGLLVAAAAVVAAIAMGGGDDNGDRDRIRAAMAAEMKSSGDLSQKQAECIADAIIDEVGTDKLKDVDFTADEPPAEIADDVTNALLGSLKDCDVDASGLAGGSDTTDTSEPLDIGGFDGSIPPNFEEQLANLYENSLGLPREKARCLAGKLSEAVSSGDLSQEEAMTDVISFLSACDIDLSELSGN